LAAAEERAWAARPAEAAARRAETAARPAETAAWQAMRETGSAGRRGATAPPVMAGRPARAERQEAAARAGDPRIVVRDERVTIP
jgi:hypothetical protein